MRYPGAAGVDAVTLGDHIYRRFDIDRLGLGVDALPELLKATEWAGFAGVNVTHPCKQAVLPLMHEMSDDARALGAANTVVLRDGKRIGHNTDWWGFAEGFKRGLPDAKRDRVVQLGAGVADLREHVPQLQRHLVQGGTDGGELDQWRGRPGASAWNERWSAGRVTLLGDAAHPMYPIGSNGATQAIMDAQALADALSATPDLNTALAAYENERRPLCARIVEMNRREGLDAILDRVESLAPEGFSRLEDVIDPAEVAREINSYKAAAGHRLTTGAG